MDWHYLFISLDGRINRKPYWIGAILIAAIGISAQYFTLKLFGSSAAFVIGLVFLYPSLALMLKRAHDRNRPTWLVLVFLAFLILASLMNPEDIDSASERALALFLAFSIPWFLLSLFFLVDLGFLRGTKGPNRYGPDPLA